MGVRAASSAVRPPSSNESREVRWFAWADLLRQVFEIDVLACVACGGRLRLVATIDQPDASIWEIFVDRVGPRRYRSSKRK